LSYRDDGQADEAGCAGGAPDALRGLLVVGGLGVEDVRDEGLRVAVVEGEEGGLDLDHDAVSGLEDVVDLRETEFVEQRLVGLHGFGFFEAGAVAATEDVERDGELVALHRFRGGVFGVDGDDFDDPVAVGAAGGGVEVDLGWAADAQGLGERSGGVGEDVGAAVDEALVGDEPGAPVFLRDRTGQVGDGLGGVGGVLVVLVGCGCWGFKGETAVRG